MFDITKGFDNINLELWDDFPHNFTEPEIWKEFVKKMFDFLK